MLSHPLKISLRVIAILLKILSAYLEMLNFSVERSIGDVPVVRDNSQYPPLSLQNDRSGNSFPQPHLK